MLHNYKLSFPQGSIITGAQLDLLSDQLQRYLYCRYIDYSDGVISGMDPRDDGEQLLFLPGIYKFHNKFYLLEEPFPLQMSRFVSGQQYFVTLSTSEATIVPNISDSRLEFTVSDSSDCIPNEGQPVCSFCGKPRLPRYCRDVLSPNFNLLPYAQASYGEATYSKYLFKLVCQYLVNEKEHLHMLDYILISEISGCGYVSLSMMQKYIAESGQTVPSTSDRSRFFQAFIEALDLLKDEKPPVVAEDADNTDASSVLWE